jgi:DNA-directed RNA polymerase specialized sigma subunit
MKLRNTSDASNNNSATREAAILQALDLVNNTAKRFLRRVPPCVTFDDLACVGMIGLIQAVDRFDQSRGLKFKTFRAAPHLGRNAGFPSG